MKWLKVKFFKKSLSRGDRWLIEQVLSGSKHACQVLITDEAKEFAESNGLVVVLTANANGDMIIEPNQLSISFPETIASSNISNLIDEISDFPEVQQEVKALYSHIRDMTPADTLAYLCAYPRLDNDGHLLPNNIERAGVALLFGLICGYRVCCVSYYIATRYRKVMRHLESTAFNHSGFYLGVLCNNCNSDYENYQKHYNPPQEGYSII